MREFEEKTVQGPDGEAYRIGPYGSHITLVVSEIGLQHELDPARIIDLHAEGDLEGASIRARASIGSWSVEVIGNQRSVTSDFGVEIYPLDPKKDVDERGAPRPCIMQGSSFEDKWTWFVVFAVSRSLFRKLADLIASGRMSIIVVNLDMAVLTAERDRHLPFGPHQLYFMPDSSGDAEYASGFVDTITIREAPSILRPLASQDQPNLQNALVDIQEALRGLADKTQQIEERLITLEAMKPKGWLR